MGLGEPEKKKEQTGAESEIGKQVKEEQERIGFFVDGDFFKVTVPLDNPYLALGILYDALCDIRDRLSMARVASENQRRKLAGKDTLIKGAKQDRSFWNKLTRK